MNVSSPVSVTIGPTESLHPGIHGSLIEDPPPGVAYVTSTAGHISLLRQDSSFLFADLASGDFLQFPGQGIIHACHLPVLESPGWILDTDCFVHWMACGEYAITQTFRDVECRRQSRTGQFERRLRRRLRVMLGALGHPSCVGVLLRTERERALIANWCRDLSDRYVEAAIVESVIAKLGVLHPSVRPEPEASCAPKWTTTDSPRIVFCGRAFADKNGAVALDCFERVLNRVADAKIIYIGRIPSTVKKQFTHVLERIIHIESLPRKRVLDIFGSAHLLFHAATFETAGCVFSEAMAAGMAILAPLDGAEHLQDWCGAGAALIDRTGLTRSEVIDRFSTALINLMEDMPRMRSMAIANYRAAAADWCATGSKNDVLRRLYAQAAEQRHGPVLHLSDIVSDNEQLARFGDGEFAAHARAYRAAHGTANLTMYQVLEL
jgi:glycosyltransferase involved in cell wall biosynthesis